MSQSHWLGRKKIIFCVPYLHLNMKPWVRAIEAAGGEVAFIVLSPNTANIDEFNVIKRYPKPKTDKQKRTFFPSICELKQLLDDQRPDIIIIRECYLLNIIVAAINRVTVRALLLYYDQLPLESDHKLRCLMNLVTSAPVVTPVKAGAERTHSTSRKNRLFLPFVFEPISRSELEGKLKGAEGTRLRVVTVGKYGSVRKNLVPFFEKMIPLLKQGKAEITFVGSLRHSRDPLFLKLRNRTIEEGLEGRVAILSNLSQADLFKQYRNADLFILPSFNEPASVSQFEAMAHGLPTIVTSSNGTSYAVTQNFSGYVVEPSLAGMEALVEGLADNRGLLRQMSRNALTEIENYYSRRAFVLALLRACTAARPNHYSE